MLGAAIALGGCGEDRPAPADRPASGAAVALSRGVSLLDVSVPPDSRGGRAPADRIPVVGPWTVSSARSGAARYVAALPVRPRGLFFHKPPPGLQVFDAADQAVPFGAKRGPTWAFDARSLTVDLDESSPVPDGWTVRYPAAQDRERRLNHAWSGIERPEDFVHAALEAYGTTRDGLFLPAPATAAVEITLPVAAELTFDIGLVPPEVLDDRPSGGAVARVVVIANGAETIAWTGDLQAEDAFRSVRVDLSPWSGQRVRLRFVTEPGADNRFDYVLFGDPIVASRVREPRRVILVFADTVRRDALGVYGYDRDTSEPLDKWAAGAAVFEDARSVAPWTLPSARTVLTGRSPESWTLAPTLQGTLRDRGWATAEIAGNVYLSSNFGMHRDFGLHQVERAVPAKEQVDRALEWLDTQSGRDALVVVHLMDAHLPYQEPPAYRFRYATPGQAGSDVLPNTFERSTITRLRAPSPATRRYVRDRYDQAVAYQNDEIGRLLAHTGPNDVVVYFADHGEEFWDHNGFEHGHTLYDELLRVPLIIAGPGVQPGRVAGPVSLLDITPTVLDLLGEAPLPSDGRSLAPYLRGGDPAELVDRDIAFGRPLYGSERWGVVHAGQKYTTVEGRESLFDLVVDPLEKDDQLGGKPDADGAPWRSLLAEALDRDVALGYRLNTTRATRTPAADLVVNVEVPGGVRRAWVGEDPTDQSAARVTVAGEQLSAVWAAGARGPREVFFVPELPVADTTHALVLTTRSEKGEPVEKRVSADRTAVPTTVRAPLLRGPVDAGRMLYLGHAITVAPPVEGAAVNGADDELRGALEALGYVFDDAPAAPPTAD